MRRVLLGALVVLLLLGAGGALYVHAIWRANMPQQLQARVHQIAAAHGGYTPLPDIPRFLQRALIATEDRQFYHNEGIDFEGIARAFLVDLLHGRPVQGGSTITEQLVKDIFLTDAKTISRKLKQVVYAIMISQYIHKNTILALYLNEVYLGQGAYGVGSAAHIYFGVPSQRLTDAQCALLAGLPQAPSLYDPLAHYKLAKQRQWEVLQGMVQTGFISRSQAYSIYHTPLRLVHS